MSLTNLSTLPLKFKNHISMDNLYARETNAVAVRYCVLRPKTKNNCGRPGVNGGYIDNPYIKFGVNCYGKKPTPTENDLKRLEN